MCYRSVLTTPIEAIAELFAARSDELPPQPPRYNIRPTQPLVTVLNDGGRRLVEMRWGFVPSWYKTLKDGPLILNARAETIATKPAFAEACRARRCLVPFDGYYEWTVDEFDNGKNPWLIHAAAGGPLAVAGIWQNWRGPEGETLQTVAIVTCASNRRLHNLHDRMPVMIAPENFALWLGEAGHGAAQLMVPAPDDLLEYYRVGRRVNGAKDDSPDLIQPLDVAV